MIKTNATTAGLDLSRHPVLYGLTAIVVLAGIYFRFKGIGFSPFAIDEYYLATSVRSILEHGVPMFEGGGYYTRGIALQYMAAALFLSGLDHEFAFRLLTAVFNLAALPAVFLLGRSLAGVTAGCVALMLYSLSVWEVEFARFARMYAPFGAFFVWHLYFVHRRIVLDDPRASWWMYLLAFAAMFFSEFAVFLAVLNFLPVLLRRAHRPVVEYLVPTLLMVLTYLWESINFRRLGAPDHLPPEMMAGGPGGPTLPIHLPPVLLPETMASLPWLLGFMVPLLLAMVVAGVWVRWAVRIDGTARTRLLAVLPIGILVFALLNLFGMVVYAAIVLMLLSGLERRELLDLARRPLVLLTGLSVVISFVFWCAYVASTDWWQFLLPISTGVHLKDAVLLLFNYPDVLGDVIVPWRAAMPLQSILMSGLVLIGVWYASGGSEPHRRGYLLLTAIMVGMFVLVPVFAAPYSTTRYTYFIYALLLILSAAALVYMAQSFVRSVKFSTAASVALAFALMFLSEDFQARHLLEIDSERVTYRMGYPSGKVGQYYTRWDFRGPAEFVNAKLEPGDIVISAEYGVPYYLERMDYLYMDQDGGRFEIISGQHGTRDIWEGAKLVREEARLFKIIENAAGTVWLIARSDNYGFQTDGERLASGRLDDLRVYRSVDGHLDVYRIPPTWSMNGVSAAE